MSKYKGEVFDYAIDPITGEKKLIHHGYNLVVDSASRLIASLMHGNNSGSFGGVKYFAVGKGSDKWLNESPPSPTADATKLVAETYRKAISSDDIVFIDNNNMVSDVVTNRIQIKTTFMEDEANGELREIGIFGGDATGEADSGYMINWKIHPLIYKTNGMRLERVVRFTF